MKFYLVTYTRKMGGSKGKRVLCTNVRMSDRDLALILTTPSRFEYDVLSATQENKEKGLED